MTLSSEKTQAEWTEAAIMKGLVELLEDMITDWDTDFDGAIGPDTRLVADLEFESIDIVQFIVAIEERFQCKGLPFEEFLMTDGRYVDEIRVRDAVAFLHRHLNTRRERAPVHLSPARWKEG
jgi:acyl carrier protein